MAGENNLAEERARNMAEFDLQTELQSVFDAANRSNTAIYAVDPRGLSTGEFDIADNIGPRQSQESLRSTLATLQVLAENTDGRAIVNRNDLAKGMEQIVRDSSAYYLVGYNSTQAPQDGKFHPIRVRIKRPGVQIRARKGYWALSADETARATAPAKAGPPPPACQGDCQHGAGEQSPLRPDLDGHGARRGRPPKMTFVWEPIPAAPGVKREEPRQVSLVAASPTGEEFFSGPVGDTASERRSGASVSFDVKPGRVRLRLAVEGEGPAPLDSEDREVTVPDLTSSDLRLATPRVFVARTAREYQQLKADADPTPTALREFRRTDRLVVRFNTFGKPTGCADRHREAAQQAGAEDGRPARYRPRRPSGAQPGGFAAVEHGGGRVPAGSVRRLGGPDAGDRTRGVQADELVQFTVQAYIPRIFVTVATRLIATM